MLRNSPQLLRIVFAGHHSQILVDYFSVSTVTEPPLPLGWRTVCCCEAAPETMLVLQAFEGVDAIQEGINPATWMLEVTGSNVERKIGKDFAELFEQSDLHKCAALLHECTGKRAYC